MSEMIPDPEAYFGELIPPRPELLLRLEREARAEEIPLVGPLEGALLQLLVSISGARRILELGTATGYSALFMAAALPPGRGELLTLELDPDMVRRARENIAAGGVTDRVTVQQADVRTALASLKGPFDLVFMDIEKRDYLQALPQCWRLLKPGGLLVADNTAFADADPFNRALAQDRRWRQVNLLAFWPGHHPQQDGVALALRV